jgi:hypothetical protein
MKRQQLEMLKYLVELAGQARENSAQAYCVGTAGAMASARANRETATAALNKFFEQVEECGEKGEQQ